ncbi:alkylation response protein AidB-like acyl-CoA dehydrogenase [Nocardioides zeae]|uniref:Alkylation response protein AidB-like acyl-CoA dehydrogenase n=1 Tax=Nocardioides zeae TaxID=1457234 RepID=A0ACC6IJ69_9ACTN|nr:acyl-CoA dehydrogenase family protein [Nocardioides zeae]MDR6174677.1 alkylation response protein AidB-like acyl-CoA dehydrogenase [Nocardioides zeae]MDR6210746.1 alkylation response protein AidB-like acyl-CoA dehydrogenase [Nocardioides zeae]
MLKTEAGEAFRSRVRSFLDRELGEGWAGIGALAPEERAVFRGRWREALREERLLAPTWPEEHGGGGLGLAEQAILQAELVEAGVPVLPFETDQFAFTLIGPTLLHWGTPAQKARFLPRMITAEDRWAQGYSEPGAGSDLFALSTRAVLDGDEWVVNGQKVWQTAAQDANWIFALVRTEPGESRGRGISMLLIPIDQPGVEVRPIRTITGEDEFCEVFFTDARTAADNVVGPRGAGAKVALTLLGFERGSASGALYAGYRIELDRLIELVRERGLDRTDWVRDRIAQAHLRLEMLRYLGERNLAGALSGAPPGPESSIIKLYESEYHAQVTELALELLGDDATAWRGEPGVAHLGPDPLGSPSTPAAWIRQFLTARAATIYGGSSEIQRNTLGEQVLGLPREPRPVQEAR